MPGPALLLSTPEGQVIEHPHLLATVRSGEDLCAPFEKAIALPLNAQLAQLPGRLPVGIDPQSGEFCLVQEFKWKGKKFIPQAVGALLPPGYTRTFLPGEVRQDSSPLLPQWAYTAAAWSSKGRVTGPVVWAMRTDLRNHWSPQRFSTEELAARVESHLRLIPNNRVLKQLKTCALSYRCFTSQNIFYVRDEGAIPASVHCNARCIGCISDQPKDGSPASHQRMDDGPSGEEMGQVGLHHLKNAKGRTMVSFGQGCEGEPLTRYRAIADSIRFIRERTDRGSININTNASLTHGLAELFEAGLDAVRVSLNSANKELYEAYYLPVKYGWEDVEASISLARDRHAYLALNLLLFPGVTDRQGEVEALKTLVRRYRVDQIQTRSLCIDPMQYLTVAHNKGAGGAPMGVRKMLVELKKAWPKVRVGNFARGLDERRAG